MYFVVSVCWNLMKNDLLDVFLSSVPYHGHPNDDFSSQWLCLIVVSFSQELHHAFLMLFDFWAEKFIEIYAITSFYENCSNYEKFNWMNLCQRAVNNSIVICRNKEFDKYGGVLLLPLAQTGYICAFLFNFT